MTRPVYEPTLARTDAALGYGTDQLFRRPAPPSGAADVAWARRSKGFDASNQLISSSAIATVTHNHDYNMGAGESGDPFFTPNGNGIQLLVHGWHIVTAEVLWVEGFTSNVGIGISDLTAPAQHWSSQTAVSFTTISHAFTFAHRWPANTVITLVVFQVSGTNKNVDAAYLEVEYIADYTGTEYTAMNPDQ